MSQPMKLGFLAILSLLLIAIHLPSANTSPLEFSERDPTADLGSRGNIGPGKLGAVASESSVCSRHGSDILKKGGNAADAVSIPISVGFGLNLGADNDIVGCNRVLYWCHR